MQDILFAFFLTVLAGLATGIGGLIAFLKKPSAKFLSASLGFSAGVMIYVSMIEIFVKAQDALTIPLGEKMGAVATVCGFFGGMLFICIIDRLIPSDTNPHEVTDPGGLDAAVPPQDRKTLLRTGTFTALAIAIHNFPEGLATFISALQEPSIAIPIVVAIAIHNIPEGIAVSVPVFYATGSRRKAFLYSFLSGLAEPMGALVGYLILLPFMSDLVFGVLFAAVAGIMVFISLDELLPTARAYGQAHLSIYGLIGGMAVMAASLLLFL